MFSQSDAFSSPKFNKPTGTSIKTRGKIETIDDEQDPDLIPHYPRLTNIHQEELIPMNSDPSFLNRDRHKNTNDFLHDVEINFNGLLMNGKVPESCVWNLFHLFFKTNWRFFLRIFLGIFLIFFKFFQIFWIFWDFWDFLIFSRLFKLILIF